MSNDRTHEERDWDTCAVLFRNATWAVTTYGIENVAGPYHYHIEKECLLQAMGDGGWPAHMREKTWVDAADFAEVFAKALSLHGMEMA
jgi:hypothetical protein